MILKRIQLWFHCKMRLNRTVLKHKNAILAMATGTGKTKTSFKIINSLKKEDLINSIIISMHDKDLINQWKKDI